jgi:hypothetical protein
MGGVIPDTIIEYIREKTGGLLKENNKEYQVYCPFCDDAYRKPNPRWGHLYIAKDKPVFYCHRCNAKGHLIKLLQYLEFPDIDKYKYILGYRANSLNIKTIDIIGTGTFRENVSTEQIEIEIEIVNDQDTIQQIEQYLNRRTYLTRSDMERYLMKPVRDKTDRIGILFLARGFINRQNTIPFQIRFINSNKLRYRKLISGGNFYYYLTNISSSASSFLFQINHIIITEGPFDTINLFNFYESKYDKLLVISVSGSYYQKLLTKVLYYFPFVKSIDLFIDQDIDCYRLNRSIMRDIRFTFSKIQQMKDREFTLSIYKSATSKDYGNLEQMITPVKLKEEVVRL